MLKEQQFKKTIPVCEYSWGVHENHLIEFTVNEARTVIFVIKARNLLPNAFTMIILNCKTSARTLK